MYNITLICSRHREAGKCNSEELHKIIVDHKPEIIFEELSPAVFEECYTFNSFGIPKRTTLESKAIKMYWQQNDLKHIPVVDLVGDEKLDSKFQAMNSYLGWRNILDEIEFLESCYGSPFLNSTRSEQLFENIQTLEKKALEFANNENLSRSFRAADDEVENYEDAIIKNVYQYSEQNAYDRGLMFIGAAHRKSIIGKIQDFNTKNVFKLNWKFYNDQN